MFLLDGRPVHEANDLVAAAACEFGVLRALDAELGLIAPVDGLDDPLGPRLRELSAARHAAVLLGYRREFGDQVVHVPPPPRTVDAVATAHEQTRRALAAGAPVIHGAVFRDDDTVERCDLLVRTDAGYAAHAVTLGRRPRVGTLLRLAAQADALYRSGFGPAPEVVVHLGHGTVERYPLAALAPVHAAQHARLQQILAEKQAELLPVQWGDDRYTACGRCPACVPELDAHRDLLLVAGMRHTHRTMLLDNGIHTIDALAESPAPISGLPARTVDGYRAQARLQLRQEHAGAPVYEIVDPAPLAALPAPDPGDLFLDLEGDPLWSTRDDDAGLEYLIGTATADGSYRAYWAQDRAGERAAFLAFLDDLAERRRAHPGLHVYHYAGYEKSALLRLAGRHGVGEETVDEMLRRGVLVDLYPLVRAAIRIGGRAYGLKQVESVYLPPRAGDVRSAVDSVAAYADHCALRDAGELAEADAVLDQIARYNADDCRSTAGLRDWLRALAPGRPVPTRPDEPPEPDEHPLAATLTAYATPDPGTARTSDQTAVALLSAALGYHRRERKPFWWAHFDRLDHPVDEWSDTRDVLVAEQGTIDHDWHRRPKQRLDRRIIRLTGRFGTSSTLGPGADVYTLYDPPAPEGLDADGPAERGTAKATVLARDVTGEFADVVEIEELLPKGAPPHDRLPMAIAPGPPIPATPLERAIETVAERVAASLPQLPDGPTMDILRRRPPRGQLPTASDGDQVAALVAAVRSLDGSYVAVQGPPGTGKTHVGSRVIAELVGTHGWRVGVLAQSHAVVENMLDAVLDAGVPADRVAKKDTRATDARWRTIAHRDYPAFLAEPGGRVLGGTAWDFANPARVEPGSLDLLVIDEAGQFALADTIAVAASARNLLLLGDPQQLPQVTQGTHPEPVDTSALGWLTDGHGTLPADRGYFLDRTWRMHPRLCAPVSELSYDGRLRAHESVAERRELAGVEPGVHAIVVDHRGCATESPAEADEVVRQVRALLGRSWRDGDATRPLGQDDILVVAPYNAQVALIRTRLAAARLTQVPVGTVDNFQGREAVVVIVSMTASAIDDIPRGMAFLLSRNRLDVALSRGRWAAIVVRSRLLTDYLPASPDALLRLGAFQRLTDQPKLRSSPR